MYLKYNFNVRQWNILPKLSLVFITCLLHNTFFFVFQIFLFFCFGFWYRWYYPYTTRGSVVSQMHFVGAFG